MPIINLIQEQRLADQKRDQRTRIAGYTFVITVAGGVLGYGIMFFERNGYQTEINQLNQEIATNKPVMTQIDQCQKAEDKLKPRLQILSDAQKVTGKWSDILTRLQTQTPTDSWLTGLQCPPVADDKPIGLTFTGSAKAQDPISEFTLRTQNQPNLDNVTLHFTQEKRQVGTTKLVDFEIGAEIHDSAQVVQKAKEEQS